MKKLVIAVLAVGFVVVTAQAQKLADENTTGNSWNFVTMFTKGIETAALKAAEENNKIDFSGLHGSMHASVKSTLKAAHPNFTRMVYLGEIGEEERQDWSTASSTKDHWYFYYFVVTENGTDYFYAATRHWHRFESLVSKTEDGPDGSLFPMGVAPTDPTLSKQTLEDLKAKLPEPFNKQMKELLKGISLSTIESINVVKEREAQKNDQKYTEYQLHYTLKDGTTVDRELTYLHPRGWNYSYGGGRIGGMIQ